MSIFLTSRWGSNGFGTEGIGSKVGAGGVTGSSTISGLATVVVAWEGFAEGVVLGFESLENLAS